MISLQREIINKLSVEFKRDGEDYERFLDRVIYERKEAAAEYLKISGARGYILGLSGGLDSFAAAALLAEAGLCVHAIMIPCQVQADIGDAIDSARVLEKYPHVNVHTISIDNGYSGVLEDIKDSPLFDNNKYVLGNIQARLRMVVQYALSHRLLVVGTDHATENVVGYFTKYGDGGTDFNPLDGLLKPDIYEIAKRFEAPRRVIEKKPAAGLGISLTDEDELKMSYSDIALYLKGSLNKNINRERIEELFNKAEHKRHVPARPLDLWWRKKREMATHIVMGRGVKQTVEFINENPDMQVLYIKNGEFAREFYTDIKKSANTPVSDFNVFNLLEGASFCAAYNPVFGELKNSIGKKILLSGIFDNFLIQKSAEEFTRAGYEVYVLSKGSLFYPDSEGVFSKLLSMGVGII